MKTLVIAVLTLSLAVAGGTRAADAPQTDRHAWCDHQWRAIPPGEATRAEGYQPFMERCLTDCPDVGDRAARRSYAGRARDYCEVRWRDLIAARNTAGETHDRFIDRCARRCVAERGATSNNQLGLILAGVGLLALGGGVAAGAGGHGSSGPPASP